MGAARQFLSQESDLIKNTKKGEETRMKDKERSETRMKDEEGRGRRMKDEETRKNEGEKRKGETRRKAWNKHRPPARGNVYCHLPSAVAAILQPKPRRVGLSAIVGEQLVQHDAKGIPD
jgi:hypothetical protein